jgi:uncharacterized pyridoxal phosphate-containing UPF0001 family protein
METFRVEKIAENLEHVRSQIADAAKKKGRSPDEIELVAISKTHDAEKVRAASEAGQTLFGESRVQEARAKIPLLPSSLRWHFVGHLQKQNPACAYRSSSFHSVDSLALAQDERIANEGEYIHAFYSK